MSGPQPSPGAWGERLTEEDLTATDDDRNAQPPSTAWDFLDKAPTRRPARRGRLAFAAAALPWAVLVLLLAGPFRRTAPPSLPPPGDSGAATAPNESPSSGAPSDLARAPGPLGPPEQEAAGSRAEGAAGVRFGGRVAVGPGDAAAVAMAVARAWLGDVGPPLELGLGRAGTGAYVEHLAVEAVNHPAPGAAVVTLVAVLLDAERGTYRSARVVRIGVPVRLDRVGARPAGVPWWLPAPELAPAAPTWMPVREEPELAEAGAALEAAGYRSVEVRSLDRSDSWPWRVVAVAAAPGVATPSEHTVWLREHLGQLVVAGWLPLRDAPAPSPEAVEGPTAAATR